jgi:hypothetical protein
MNRETALEMNGGEDEDEALRRAIAMSLGERNTLPGEKSAQDPIQDANASVVDLTSSPKAGSRTGAGTAQSATAPAVTMLGLDRTKMEEDRLARLGKRKATEPLGDQPVLQKPKPHNTGILSPHLASALTDVQRGGRAAQDVTKGAGNAVLPYRKGVVKRTWAAGYPRTGDDIRLEEILQKDELELAVMSSYMWDDEWLLMSKINWRKTKVILVAFASSETHVRIAWQYQTLLTDTDPWQKEEMRSNVPGSRIRFCFPPMRGSGAMHSKLQLLKFPTHLRVVVPSGNLVPFDWGETGTMENVSGLMESYSLAAAFTTDLFWQVVFLIDLPRLEQVGRQESLTPFGEDLCYFLRAQGLEDGLVDSLRYYDFSETENLGFVHTMQVSEANMV